MQQDGLAESSPGLWWDVMKSVAKCDETVTAIAPATLKSVRCQSVLKLAGSVCFPGICLCCLLGCQRRSRFQITLGHYESYITAQ